jgi:hypothetical protein
MLPNIISILVSSAATVLNKVQHKLTCGQIDGVVLLPKIADGSALQNLVFANIVELISEEIAH